MKQKSILAVIIILTFIASQKIFAETNFVGSFGSPTGNYYTVIQDAVDNTYSNDVVIVSNGVYNTGGGITPGYACSNRVVITNNITVRSANGPENTVIMGAPDPVSRGLGDNAVRGVYMSAGILSGFTISNGHTMASGTPAFDRTGGGVYMSAGVDANGVLTNCIVSENLANVGGGTYNGILYNCTINANSAFNPGMGGGCSCGIIYSCTISSNIAETSAGSDGANLQNCIINGNTALSGHNGGGFGNLNNCTIIGNKAKTSNGGCGDGNYYNCLVIGNTAEECGGMSSLAYNCLIVGNVATVGNSGGGGSGHNHLYNCTIVGNVSSNYGGGTMASDLKNCIVYYNYAPNNPDFSTNEFGEGSCEYSCVSNIQHGVDGNITNVPGFVNYIPLNPPSTGDFHLLARSFCINAGTNAFAPMPVDLDGWPRIIGGTVDMGCYEYASPPQIETNALIFPSHQAILIAPFPTNITWDFKKITDDFDGTNLTITKVSVLLAETTNEIATVTNNVSNLIGQVPWLVPEILVGGDTNYVLKFEVVDSDSLTNSRIFWDNKFTIVPEPGIVFGILFSVFSILIFRGKIKKIPLTPFIKIGIITAFIFTASVKANPLTIEQAEQTARNFICLRYPAKTGQKGCVTKLGTSALDINNIELLKLKKKDVGFVVNLSPSGFVLMRADDQVPPLKLYSDKGSFSNLPPVFIEIMKDELQGELEVLRKNKLTRTKSIDTQWTKDWRELIKGDNADALETYSDKVPVKMVRPEAGFKTLDAGPLLTPTVQWNQGNPYNYFCPEAPGPYGRAWAGCVATAMSQIMKYHNHPIHGLDSHTYTNSTGIHSVDFESTYYDWANMPVQLAENSPQVEIEAVARLMYHCGVSVEMEYGGGGSGANLYGYELEKYFRYRCDDDIARSGFSDSNWYAKIEKDIEGNLPIYYTFRTLSSGHAVVCDGCRSNDQIYINFGWGGSYNAWYDMNNIAGGFNYNHKAIFKIRPCGSNSIYYVDPSSPSPASPYSTWETAAHTIEEALYICGYGQTTIVANSEYFISNTLELSVNVTLISDKEATNTIINGSGLRRCVYMQENAVLDGFTITNGCADNGAGVYGENNPVIRNCIISGNNATNSNAMGGGVYSFSGVIVSNCIISGNSSESIGGGVCFWGGGILNNCVIKKNSANTRGGGGYFISGSSLSNSAFIDNLAQDGGGVYLSRSKVADCVIAGNTATNIGIGGIHGGGIYCSFESEVQSCIITQNTLFASYMFSGGGGIYCYPGSGTTVVNKCIIEYNAVNVNSSYSGGGGIYCNGFSSAEVALITDCQIRYNSINYNSGGNCGGGGGFFRNIGTVQNCVLQGNDAGSSYYGGGVFCYNGGEINNCYISGNSVNYYGGGVYCYMGGTLSNCTINSNTASKDGGGIFCYYDGTVSESIISSNSSGQSGGGVYCFMGGSVQNCRLTYNYAVNHAGGVFCNSGGEIKNCTISGNSVANYGGGVYCNNSAGIVINSIIYFNNSDWYTDRRNIQGNGTYKYCCTVPAQSGAGNITADPQFVDATSGDYHLLSSSLCINSGTNAYAAGENDLDTNPRILGGTVDMGCYEYYTANAAFSPPGITSPFTVSSGDNSCFSVTNWQNVTFSGTKPVNTFAVRPWLPNGINQSPGETTWTNNSLTLNISETGASNFFYYRSMSNDYETFSAETTIVCIVNYHRSPFVDITNEPATVTYNQNSVNISGTNLYINGQLGWVNNRHTETTNLFFPVGESFSVSANNLEYDDNEITVFGTNSFGEISADTITIHCETFAEVHPFIDITNLNHIVAYNISSKEISGTNLNIAGNLGIVNDQHPETTNFFAQGFSTTILNLEHGDNLITVFGTNIYGHFTNNFVNIYRETFNEVKPYINITNAPAIISYTFSTVDISGTNNNVAGDLGWFDDSEGTNWFTRMGLDWEIEVAGLEEGDNTITVLGTNNYGQWANCSVIIHRKTFNEIHPFIDITNVDNTVAFDISLADISGTNLNIAEQLGIVNDQHPETTNFFAQGFSTTIINLEHGDNLITVFGTNIYGHFSNDFVNISRETIDEVAPYIMITSITIAVEGKDYAIAGTNNIYINGFMGWIDDNELTNWFSRGGNAWNVNISGLEDGDNIITIIGTNKYGHWTNDSVTISAVSPIHYVYTNGLHIAPFSSWLTAATNIQPAVNAASDTDTVLVTNGIYNTCGALTPVNTLSNRVLITNNITVRSANGPKNTIILG